jgi:hypothetical protein
MTVDLDKLVAIDVHVHAERNQSEPRDPVTTEILDAAGTVFRGQPAAAERARGRRLLPAAEDARGHLRSSPAAHS